MSEESTSPLLTQRHVANACQCQETTVEKWRQLGRGPRYIKVGRLVRYRRADVDEWLQAQTVDPGLSGQAA